MLEDRIEAVPEPTPASPPHHPIGGDDLLWEHLKSLPAFRALLRAVEARFYRHIQIPGPILDIGCGDGHFAQLAFPSGQLAAGVDPWWNPLRKARQTGQYHILAQGMGDRMPFPDNHFASAISNSVLEHIPEVQPVLNDISRVLQPGGRLVVTMPSHYFTEFLGGARYLGDSYRRFFNWISRHAHTEPPEWWAERFAQAGFQVVRWQYYFSPAALHALEVGHVQGLPSALLHALTGHWILGPWEESLRPTERWLRPFYEEPFPERGAYLLMIAERVARGPLVASLPPPEPFTVAELEARAQVEVSAATRDTETALQAVALPGGSQEADGAAVAPGRPEAAPGAERVARPQGRGRVTGWVLAGLALLLALAGQSALVNEPAERAGLWMYGFGLLAFGTLVIMLRSESRTLALPRLASIARQRWFYLVALFLAWLAYQFAGPLPTTGNPVLAILLWLAATAVAVYALREPSSEPNRIVAESAGQLEVRPVYAAVIALVLFGGALLLRTVGLTTFPDMMNGVEASLGLDAVSVSSGVISNPFATGWLTNPTLPAFILSLPVALFGQTVLGARILSALVGALTVALVYLVGRRVWGERIALVAAILLAGSHVHLQYSRLGMSNAWDPLMMFLPIGLLTLAWRTSERRIWLAGGAVSGLAFYFYTSARLLPLVIATALLYLLLANRQRLQRESRHLLAALALALVVMLPQLLFYSANPGIYTQRLENVGILQSEWLARETELTGLSTLALLAEQFRQAALAFHATVDTSTGYNAGTPLLRFVPALLFSFGLVLALLRWRQFRWAILLLWVAITVVFAGALLVQPPDSHRYVNVLPGVMLIIAGIVVWTADRLMQGATSARPYVRSLLIVLAVALVAGDLLFYFGSYRTSGRFGDRNTEIAYEMALYLNALEESGTAYLFGPPTLYADFPTLAYLAPDFVAGRNLLNVEANAPVPPPVAGNMIFLILPERSVELEAVRAIFPDGETVAVPGTFGDPLFLVYQISP